MSSPAANCTARLKLVMSLEALIDGAFAPAAASVRDGNIPGAVLGGLLIGITETMVAGYLSSTSTIAAMIRLRR